MQSELDIKKMQLLVQERRVIWRRHALERLLERGLTRSMVFDTLMTGELIEDYSTDRSVPSGLILGWQASRPLHVVIALEEDGTLAIITAYEPTPEHFESDFRTRRKP